MFESMLPPKNFFNAADTDNPTFNSVNPSDVVSPLNPPVEAPVSKPWLKPTGQALKIDPTFTLDLMAQWQAQVAPLFNAQQQVLLPDTAEDVTLMQGGYGCGKTFTAVLFALHQAFMQPGTVGLIVGANQFTLTDGVFTMVKDIAKALGLVAGQDYALRYTNKRILLKNGSIIYCRTRRQPPLHADFAVCEGLEHFTQAQFAQVLAQLTQKPVRLLATMLPAKPPAKPTTNHPWQQAVFKSHTPGFRHVVVKTSDNPYLPPTYLPMLKAAMPQAHWPMLLDGEIWPDKMPTAVKSPQGPYIELSGVPTPKPIIKGAYRQKYW